MRPDLVFLAFGVLVSGAMAVVFLVLAFRPRGRRSQGGVYADKPTVPSSSEAPTEPPAGVGVLATPERVLAPAGEQEGETDWDALLASLEHYQATHPESGISPASAYRRDGGRISKSALKRLIRRLEEAGDDGPAQPPAAEQENREPDE